MITNQANVLEDKAFLGWFYTMQDQTSILKKNPNWHQQEINMILARIL